METLLANVFDQSLHLPPVIVSFDQTQIEHGSGGRRNHIASQRADVAAADTVDVQRRLVD